MTTMELDTEVLRKFEESTHEAYSIQLQTLRDILHRNGDVPYLRRHLPRREGVDGDRSVDVNIEDFRRFVPISSYGEDYADIIQKMADEGGDSPSVLSFDPLVCFFYSSGTSSMKPKMIPYFDLQPAKAATQITNQASSAILRRRIPPRKNITKILWFLYAGIVTETKSGIKAMAATAFPMHSKVPSSSLLFDRCISPPQVLLGSDTHQQMYCHLLCGLRRFDTIDGIRAPYAIGLVRVFQLLESKWENLCQDIEHGHVNSEITDSAMRQSVNEFLDGPRPDIAKRIRDICGMQDWKGIIHQLWPEARYIACVTTGSMEQYYPLLKLFTGEIIPVLCGDYLSSECSIGINLDKSLPPQETRYTILPNAAYFEFLPFELGSGEAEKAEMPIDISGLEIRKIYEIVVTTFRGLYRYRLGDIVRVVGFYNSTPQVEFISRAPNKADDIFTERDLAATLKKFQVMLKDEVGGEVVEYTSFVDLEAESEHVIIFVEVKKLWASRDIVNTRKEQEKLSVLISNFSLVLEDCLGSVYKLKRKAGDLCPLEISIVKPGSFDELINKAIENGAPANQYKPPKILRNKDFAQFLRTFTLF